VATPRKLGHTLTANPAPPPPDGLDEVLHAVEATTRANVTRAPAMEIVEEPQAFVLACEVPGAEREDIRVDVSPHRVLIAALPRTGGSTGGSYQDFERAIPLPSEVRPEQAEARLNNGVLEVVLPKKRAGGSGVYRLPAQ
jgi:HSP20 family molecular chaperone IbpA